MENDNLIRDSVLKDARWSQQMGDNIKVIRKVCTKKDRRKVGKTKKKKKKTCRTVKYTRKRRIEQPAIEESKALTRNKQSKKARV